MLILLLYEIAWGAVNLACGLLAVRPVGKRLDRFLGEAAFWARKPRLPILALALLAALVAAGIARMRPPLPSVHDEFSYLLAADTFAHGRLTNAPHAMWEHVETFHVLQQPTYASKYPPGQGLMLALGKVLANSPALGLWISVSLVAGAMTWMLRGWMPGRWALLGGLLVVFHANIQLRWSQTYWGGNVALLGAALVLGAYPRLRRSVRCRDAWLMSCGLAILMNSRPYEGLAFSLPVAGAMLRWIVTARATSQARIVRNAVIPLTLTLALSLALMAYYNWRVTGRAWQMPYQVHEATYGYIPSFHWQALRPVPEYRHEVMRRFYLELVPTTYIVQRTWAGLLSFKAVLFLIFWSFAVGVGLTFPLLLMPRFLVSPRNRLPLAVVIAVMAALLGATWIYPHYAAPAVPAALLLAVQGLRRLNRLTWRDWETGRFLTRGIVFSQIFLFLGTTLAYVVTGPPSFAKERNRLLNQLQDMPGRHLVMVQYGPDHSLHEEWVYNEADVDAAQVIWARSMTPAADRRLRNYFSDRRTWLVTPDEPPIRLIPCDEQDHSGGAWRSEREPPLEGEPVQGDLQLLLSKSADISQNRERLSIMRDASTRACATTISTAERRRKPDESSPVTFLHSRKCMTVECRLALDNRHDRQGLPAIMVERVSYRRMRIAADTGRSSSMRRTGSWLACALPAAE